MVFRMVGVLFFWGSSLIHGDAVDINDIRQYSYTDMGYGDGALYDGNR